MEFIRLKWLEFFAVDLWNFSRVNGVSRGVEMFHCNHFKELFTIPGLMRVWRVDRVFLGHIKLIKTLQVESMFYIVDITFLE